MLSQRQFQLTANIKSEEKRLDLETEEGGCFEALNEYEHRYGVDLLLQALACGEVEILARNEKDIKIALQVLLRCPEDSKEHFELFKDIISTWVEEDNLTFCERFFRLPKISEDLTDRYLDNPLEHLLRKSFGFHFTYRIVIRSESDSPESQDLRAKLTKIIAYS